MGRSITLALAFVATSVGCGARTDGLIDDVEGDFPADPFGDASRDASGMIDARGRDAGGSLDVGSRVDSATPVDSRVRPADATSIDSGPVLPPGCPSVLPKDGTPCAATELACLYPGCDAKEPDRAECSVATARKWKVTAAACATDPARCPIAEPLNGSPCTVPPGELCWYDAECLRRSIAQCSPTTLTWAVKKGACPDTSRCPTSWPSVGAPCPETDPKKGFSCDYINACGLYQTFICEGSKGVWTEIAEPCSSDAKCPAVQPAIGTSCGALPDGTNCAWPNACGSVDHMDCASGKWRMFHRGKCPDGPCPLTPVDGATCTDTGRMCTYPIGGGCSLACTCASGGAWTCKQPPCGADTSGGK
jgi:hypothetical protein